MSSYREIRRCRICGNEELTTVFDLGAMALTGIFPRDPEATVERSPLELVKCGTGANSKACGLVQLKHSVDPGILFGGDYGYRSGLNRWMVEHLEGIARHLQQAVPLRAGDIVVDIGSNDGTLLRGFAGGGIARIGIDPLGAQFQHLYDHGIQLIPEFFSSSRVLSHTGGRRAKLVTSVAMLYDLEDPLDFVEQVRETLEDDGVWFCEQSYLPAMLASGSYDTVCHEHLEYYSLKQIQWMTDRAGMRILDVCFSKANGGSFAVLADKGTANRRVNEERLSSAMTAETETGVHEAGAHQEFWERARRQREQLRAVLREYARQGERVFGYGASTKGNVILQFCGITPKELPCIAEINPDKFGCFTPGTGIPIVSEEEARSKEPGAFLVLPWHFRESILAREAEYLSKGGALVFPLPEVEVCQGVALAS